MKKRLVVALFWWILVGGLLAHAEIRGGTEVEVRQGLLSRWEVSARPEPGVEARAWWAPDRGGAGWLRWHQLQIGPLVPVASLEGRRSWGAGSRLSSGHWGLSFDGQPWGFWGVQTPSSFEGGTQLRGEWGSWVAAVGGDRVWSLEAQPESPWSDRARAGLAWASGGGEAALEVEGTAVAESPWSWGSGARLGWRFDGWEISASGTKVWPWDLEQGKWRCGVGLTGELGASLSWESAPQTVRATADGTAGGLRWEARVEARVDEAKGTPRPGAGLSGRLDEGRWFVDWDARSERDLWTHRFELRWSQAGFEAEAVWKVEGQRLGWIGPGAEAELTLRWPFS